ncbi:hypothetical protein AYO40_01170 [Planctomycetaceae bacterium SCGC AG-212-D15]|nr:hypothetical protein AYO40_01170 [Planctomycetaceae bacterium SCGC AG-212-D15]
MPIAVADKSVFQDADHWKLPDGNSTIVQSVPVFDAHKEHDERKYVTDEKGEERPNPEYGKLVREFDQHKLQQICDNCNRRFERTGDATPLTLGHTRVGRPESEQPPIAGWALNFRLARVGPSKLLCIVADFFVEPAWWKEFLAHPRRSVEFFGQDMIFDPIALLIRTPERDLGLIQAYMRERDTQQAIRYAFQAWHKESPVHYAMKEEAEHMEKITVGADGDEGVKIKEGKHYEKPVEELPEKAEDKPPVAKGPDSGPVSNPEDAPGFDDEGELPGHHEDPKQRTDHAYTADRYMKHYMRHHLDYMKHHLGFHPAPHEEHTPEPLHDTPPATQHMAGAGSPSGSNTGLPVMAKDHYQREESSIHYAKRVDALEGELKSIKAERDAERAKANASAGRMCVAILEGEGYRFRDRSKEAERFSKMAEAERMDRMAEIRDCYEKTGAPTGGPFPVAEYADEPAVLQYQRREQPEQFSKEDASEAMKIAQADPIYLKTGHWEDAYTRAMETVKAKRKQA